MQLTPDDSIAFAIGGLAVNWTIVNTWLIMALLTVGSVLITRNLRPDVRPGRWRTALEVIVGLIESQIAEVSHRPDRRLIYFTGTLFLFIVTSNLLTVVPGFDPPTASLSTTAALALSVLVAVPIFGIASRGVGGYLKTYLEPSPIMLPFNIIGELSRTVALALRLFGNMLSGSLIGAIIVYLAGFLLPVPLMILSVLTSLVQAYIFGVLTLVFAVSSVETVARRGARNDEPPSSPLKEGPAIETATPDQAPHNGGAP